MNVGIENGCHLSLLDRADLALGVHDEDGNILLTAQAVDGGGTGVTTGSTNDSQVLSVSALLALVHAYEEVLEKVADELESDILESERGTVEQFHQMQVLGLVKSDDGGDIFGAEGGITAVDDVFEIGRGDFAVGDVQAEDLKGELLEGKVAPFGLPVRGQSGHLFGDEQAAVCSETLEDDVFERQLQQLLLSWGPCRKGVWVYSYVVGASSSAQVALRSGMRSHVGVCLVGCVTQCVLSCFPCSSELR